MFSKGIHYGGNFFNGNGLVNHLGKKVIITTGGEKNPNCVFVWTENKDLYIGPIMRVKN